MTEAKILLPIDGVDVARAKIFIREVFSLCKASREIRLVLTFEISARNSWFSFSRFAFEIKSVRIAEKLPVVKFRTAIKGVETAYKVSNKKLGTKT